MSTDELVAWLREQLDEDEWWARNAGGRSEHVPPSIGEHCRWEDSSNDKPVRPDPVAGELLVNEADDCPALSLRSVEEYPTRSVGVLPSFLINHAEEVNAVAAGHIIRRYERVRASAQSGPMRDDSQMAWNLAEDALRGAVYLLASAYSDRPGYRQEWAP